MMMATYNESSSLHSTRWRMKGKLPCHMPSGASPMEVARRLAAHPMLAASPATTTLASRGIATRKVLQHETFSTRTSELISASLSCTLADRLLPSTRLASLLRVFDRWWTPAIFIPTCSLHHHLSKRAPQSISRFPRGRPPARQVSSQSRKNQHETHASSWPDPKRPCTASSRLHLINLILHLSCLAAFRPRRLFPALADASRPEDSSVWTHYYRPILDWCASEHYSCFMGTTAADRRLDMNLPCTE